MLPLKRLPTEEEVDLLVEYINLLSIYLTDDHAEEMRDENETLCSDVDTLFLNLYGET